MPETIIALDPASSDEELIETIVAWPDGTNVGKDADGLAATLLTGKPEVRNPSRYAGIFDGVARHPRATPWIKLMAQSESVNGRRRLPGANMEALSAELNGILTDAERELEPGKAKHVFLGSGFYNAAIVCRGLRRYRDEEAMQRRAAAYCALAEDWAGHDTDMFAAQVGAVSHAFVAHEAAIESSIKALIAVRDFIKEQRYPLSKWMVNNGSQHIAWSIMMADIMGALDDLKLDECGDDFAEAKKIGLAPWVPVWEAWGSYCDDDYDTVIATEPSKAPSSSNANADLTLKILIALAREKRDDDGDVEEAQKLLEAVVNHQGSDGGIPITVAKHLLAHP
ncbi:MAG: hypothetical protein AAB518_04380 [Patescibacteria group bacterium]